MDWQHLSFDVLSTKAIFTNYKGESQLHLKYACTPKSKALKIPSGEMLTKNYLEENENFSIEIVLSTWPNESSQTGILRSFDNGVAISLNSEEKQLSMLMNMKANSKQPKGIDITIANAFESVSVANNSPSNYYVMKKTEYNLDSWTIVI